MKKVIRLAVGFLLLGFLLTAFRPLPSVLDQAGVGDSPDRVVKLIFIHHSTGENWLQDGYGNLGQALGENNYFVSDTNYGWGPNGIGDRTDIPDWLEWFSSPDTGTYFDALLQESGQHSDYSRLLPDPGGENQIILFKSCFPNSDLEGSPEDPPSADGWLTVGHAKYVYNDILNFFEEHPERLFVIITAPPLSDPGNAANARAFNQWLVNDWLEENSYPYQNVAVFDFYNILTGPDGHHTFQGGEEIHQVAGKNTLGYPSGDDHPSQAGSRKATEEFIPLLNYFYHRWQSTNPPETAPSTGETPGEDQPPDYAPMLEGLIDDFSGDPPIGTSGWEAFWDESTSSSLRCEMASEGDFLQLDYQITSYSWGTCGLFYDQPQNWSSQDGLGFFLNANPGEGILDVDLYIEGVEGRESYFSQIHLEPAMEEDWVQVNLAWDDFKRVDWETDAGSTFQNPEQISGLAFGFSVEDQGIQGQILIDQLGWLSGQNPEVESSGQQEPPASSEADHDSTNYLDRIFGRMCPGSLLSPLGLVAVLMILGKGKERKIRLIE
jgi:hypothetical protein